MESPPPYMPPQKTKTNPIVWWIVGGVCFCCVGPGILLVGGGLWGINQVKGFGGCAVAFNDIQKSVLKYAAEHGNKLPKAQSWQDDIKEDYRKSMTPASDLGPFFKEPSPDGEWTCTDTKGTITGMAFNTELSGKKLDDIGDQVSTIMIFETEKRGKNLCEKYVQKPYATSPILMGSTHRGWIAVPVSGAALMVGPDGRGVPVNTTTKSNGFNFKVDVGEHPINDGSSSNSSSSGSN